MNYFQFIYHLKVVTFLKLFVIHTTLPFYSSYNYLNSFLTLSDGFFIYLIASLFRFIAAN
jgi:hypothetical protein